MRVSAKRMTFRLHQPTIEGIDALVRSGMAASRNALIETLVEQALRALRRREREVQTEKIYAHAFQDGSYAKEQEELSRAFAAADAETARRLDP
jgi:Arc/MetJ-type ribon-helix-helix transcriptional regulator